MKPDCNLCACDFREKSVFYNMLILQRIHVDDVSRYVVLFVNFDVDDLSPLYSDKLRIFF